MNEPKINAFRSFLSILAIAFITSACTPSAVKENTQAEIASKTTKEVAGKQSQANAPSVPLVVAAILQVKPEQRELFLKFAKATIKPTREEPGVITYILYEDVTKPNTFIYFEEWKSRKALEEHLKQPYVKNLVDKFPELLVDGKPDIRVYDVKNFSTGLEDI